MSSLNGYLIELGVLIDLCNYLFPEIKDILEGSATDFEALIEMLAPPLLFSLSISLVPLDVTLACMDDFLEHRSGDSAFYPVMFCLLTRLLDLYDRLEDHDLVSFSIAYDSVRTSAASMKVKHLRRCKEQYKDILNDRDGLENMRQSKRLEMASRWATLDLKKIKVLTSCTHFAQQEVDSFSRLFHHLTSRPNRTPTTPYGHFRLLPTQSFSSLLPQETASFVDDVRIYPETHAKQLPETEQKSIFEIVGAPSDGALKCDLNVQNVQPQLESFSIADQLPRIMIPSSIESVRIDEEPSKEEGQGGSYDRIAGEQPAGLNLSQFWFVLVKMNLVQPPSDDNYDPLDLPDETESEDTYDSNEYDEDEGSRRRGQPRHDSYEHRVPDIYGGVASKSRDIVKRQTTLSPKSSPESISRRTKAFSLASFENGFPTGRRLSVPILVPFKNDPHFDADTRSKRNRRDRAGSEMLLSESAPQQQRANIPLNVNNGSMQYVYKANKVRRLFEVCDQDASGCVSLRELLVFLSILCRGTFEERLVMSFNIFDHDQDGMLNRWETVQFIDTLLRMISFMLLEDSSVSKKGTEAGTFKAPSHGQEVEGLSSPEITPEQVCGSSKDLPDPISQHRTPSPYEGSSHTPPALSPSSTGNNGASSSIENRSNSSFLAPPKKGVPLLPPGLHSSKITLHPDKIHNHIRKALKRKFRAMASHVGGWVTLPDLRQVVLSEPLLFVCFSRTYQHVQRAIATLEEATTPVGGSDPWTLSPWSPQSLRRIVPPGSQSRPVELPSENSSDFSRVTSTAAISSKLTSASSSSSSGSSSDSDRLSRDNPSRKIARRRRSIFGSIA